MAEDADVVSKENQNEPSEAKSELEVLKEQILQAQSLAEERLESLKRCRADLFNCRSSCGRALVLLIMRSSRKK